MFLAAMRLALTLIIGTTALTGCEEASQSGLVTKCIKEGKTGLIVRVENAANRAPLSDATVTATALATGSTETFETLEVTSHSLDQAGPVYWGLIEKKGAHTIQVTKAGFISQSFEIFLDHDGCHVIPQSHLVSLTESP